MNPSPIPDPELDPRHQQKRHLLRVVGPVVLATGGVFTIVGLVSFFRAFGGGGPPMLFWCCFVGLPLIWLGFVLTSAGFAGAVGRYMAGESAPVAKDTFNYMADGTKDGVKTIANAVGEGLAAANAGAKQIVVRCHKCNADNEAEARFCKGCGTPLAKTRPCPACNELNDPDARFCDHCGKPLTA